MRTVLAGKITAGVLTACKSAPKDGEPSFPMCWWMNKQKIGIVVRDDLATVNRD